TFCQTVIESRVKRVINYLNIHVGEIIGREYVERYFDEASKCAVHEMVNQIKFQLELSIKTSIWMSNQTKPKALLKLKTLAAKIGYPTVWRDHSNLINN